LKFEEFAAQDFQMRFSAMEIVGLYTALVSQEDTLDDSQLRVLEAVRKELYANFSIEEFELLEHSYRSKSRGWQ